MAKITTSLPSTSSALTPLSGAALPEAPVRQPAKISPDWVQVNILPLVIAARQSGDWAPLARKHWQKRADFGLATEVFGPSRGNWIGLLINCAKLTEAEQKAITRAGRTKPAKPRAIYPQAELQAWFQENVLPVILAVRQNGRWSELGSQRWCGDPHYHAALRNIGDSGTSWYGVLRQTGCITPEEEKKIRLAASSERSPQEVESFKALQSWLENTVGPIAALARRTGDWSPLTAARWRDDPQYVRVNWAFAGHVNRWYDVLLKQGLINRAEEALVRKCGERSIAAARTLYSAQELARWADSVIKPLVIAAQSNGNWLSLVREKWKADAHFLPFNWARSGKSTTWYKALRAGGYISAEQEKQIRAAGRVRKGILMHRPELPRKEACKLVVIERALYGQKRAARLGFQPVIERLAEGSGSAVQAAPAGLPALRRVVLETAGSPGSFHSKAPLDQLRLLLPHLKSAEAWNRAAGLYSEVLPALSSFLTNRVALLHLAALAAEGRIDWPASVLSLGAGTGDLFQAAADLSQRFLLAGLKAPQVSDLDYAPELLKLSPNPRKYLADMRKLPFADSSQDAIECSSPYRLRRCEAVAEMIGEAGRVLKPGGLLWLKVEGCYFAPEFGEALQTLPFRLVSPLNTELSLPEEIFQGLSLPLIRKSLAALHQTRFIFAVKTSGAGSAPEPTGFQFIKELEHDEELEVLRGLVRSELQAHSDQDILECGANFAELVSKLSAGAIEEKQALVLGLLQRHLRRLFLDQEVGSLPRGRDSQRIRMQAGILEGLVQSNLSALENAPKDLVYRFLAQSLRICERLRQGPPSKVD